MIKKLLAVTFLLTFIPGYIFSQGIIIDHTCTDISAIPSNIIDSVKQNMQFQWCGQSHSHQIPAGLNLLEAESPSFDVTIGQAELPEANGTFCVMDGLSMFNECGNCCYEYIYPHEYWSGPNAHGNIEQTFVDCYPTINVSGFVWCTECETGSSEYIQAYLDTMSVYEEMYPNVHFIYTTAHAQSSGSFGHNRYLRNEQIRQYCKENNKILYDFGDLDCWYNGEFNYYIFNEDTVPLQHPQYAEDIIYHTTEESCKNKARAMWYLMARINGWEREFKVNAKAFLEGSFNVNNMNTGLNGSGAFPLSQPFSTYPWNYSGTENVSSIPNDNIVDWILVELRDADQVSNATQETIIGTRAGFLLNNGNIVDMDGYSPLSFKGISVNDNLFFVVRHLNHLDIIGSNPANISGDTYEYDFTNSEFQSYGGAAGQKELTPGIWGMISGDGNADGIVNMDDKNVIWLNQSGQSGYKSADFNMGGKVDNRDKNEKWLENIGMESQVPN